jgi:D-isomer specific 2-hydroxyacid dehydrogenase, catalytic domain
MRPRVFITQPVAESAIERLRSVAEVESNSDAARIMTKDELLAAVREHDILFCLLQDRVNAGVIAANPKLRAIASMKITPSDIDVVAATARRIPVTVIPPLVTEATADLHFGLLLAVARRVVEGDRLMAPAYFRERSRCTSREHSSGARPLGSSAAADASVARLHGERKGFRCGTSTGARAGFPRVKSGNSVLTTLRWTGSWPNPTSSRSTPRSSPRRII